MTQGSDILVRAADLSDLEALTDLYNHYVRETAITFDTAPFSPEQRRSWLLSHRKDGPHRLLVARQRDGHAPDRPAAPGRLLGYAHSSPFKPKAAYATSVECSVYVAPDAGGRGLGTLLYRHLFEVLEGEDLHRAYAGITVPNEASVRLHRRFGFERCGLYREAGRKFGRYHDVERFEKVL
ncbi:GNAT family N-acetyltransferase [Streptomyces sp. DSM 42041]|uniref:GNAT family N-acetyltransferase n=1 Tax=Streptomyces hazeniae TaxID=3075538 RepID=A0ABU2NR23_9ACTN|nr:N-acetyltransferase family protein [Streptomyces sp. DSM 42041]MDT0379425.1 GNAT family N-acetyltransferase [Streptomyces sp. DSM 42041]